MHTRSPVRPVLIALVTTLALFVGACSDEDSPADPASTPIPTAVIRVQVTPDSTAFHGSLTGPDGFRLTCGDTTLAEAAVGTYRMVWPLVDGFDGPNPPSAIFVAAEDETIFFDGTYIESPPPPDPLNVLFIGSSYVVYNDLPGLFSGLCEAAGRDVHVGDGGVNGMNLRQHIYNAATMGLVYSRDWDHVVLQGSGGATAYPTQLAYDELWALETLIDNRIHVNHPETEVLFGVPWAYEDGFSGPGINDDYFAMQQRILDFAIDYPDEVDLVLSPVGWAWQTIMLEEPETHFLFHTDWFHPSLEGSYLTACVHYAAIFRESVVGNDFHGGVNPVDAVNFQWIASTLVLNDLETWRLAD